MSIQSGLAAASARETAAYTDILLPAIRRNIMVISGVTLGLPILNLLNKILNSWSLNNWRLTADDRWKREREVAVVTGGCGGIGKDLVLGLIRRGVKVAIFDVQPLLEDLQADANVLYLRTDITLETSIAESAAVLRKTFGDPTILINNAGIATPHTILDTLAGFLNRIFAVNAIALWLMTKEFLPSMIREDKGHIANISSVTAYMALPSMVDYCASKAASLTFHEGLNCELETKYKASGVVTTIVQPGWVRTPMSPSNADEIEKAQGKMLSPREVAERTLRQIYSGRGGQIVLPEKLWFFSSLKRVAQLDAGAPSRRDGKSQFALEDSRCSLEKMVASAGLGVELSVVRSVHRS